MNWEPVASLFLYGTLWFWVLTTAVAVIAFLFSENEMGIGGTICVVLYILLLQWCSDVDPLTYMSQHPFLSAGWVGLYFLIGVFWASIKWTMYLQDEDGRKEDVFRDYKDDNKLPVGTTFSDLTETQKAAFDKLLGQNNLSRKTERFRDHLSDYTRWLGFWLFNMLYTALNDFVRRVARALARAVAKKMQAISDRINAKWTD
jgi:hypothetical protein